MGRTLTASRGSWAGTPPLSYAYQWQRCEGEVGCSSIAGATPHRYVLTDEDLAKTIRVSVTATNASGSAGANSAQTGAVAPSRTPDGPLGDVLPSESPIGPVAGTDPFAGPDSDYVAAVEQPDVTRKPYFAGYFSPSGTGFAPHGDPNYYVSTAVGDGLVFVGPSAYGERCPGRAGEFGGSHG